MSLGDQIWNAIAAEFADLGDAGAAARVCFRLVLAALLGGALGYERESKGKSAGVRTHMLVGLGAALLVMAPFLKDFDNASISRVIQGIVAGIGFLGAGAIVKGKPGEEILGLTTAASIWMTAAIGVTVGMGRAATALISGVLALVILTLLNHAVGFVHPKNGNQGSPRSGDGGGEKG